MDLLEHQGKHLLIDGGLRVPRGQVVTSPEAARDAASALGGRVVCKAQVATGKRGKAGAVRLVDGPEEAASFVSELLGRDIAGHLVETVLVEEAVPIARELYVAVLDDPTSKCPTVLFSTQGGMDIEEVSASHPDSLHRVSVDVREGLTGAQAAELIATAGISGAAAPALATALEQLYAVYAAVDAALVEVNPLVLTDTDEVAALDAKVTIDPGSVPRQQALLDDLPGGRPKVLSTDLESRGRDLGLQYIELDGDVGVLANGAGLTMTTLDAVAHFDGEAANFLEIGGDAYTKATPALELVLSNPRVRSLLVNFCGAFARTDVMAEGVVAAIEELRPTLPISFTIHGTGEREAIQLVRDRLGIEPHDLMDDAVREAVDAARAASNSGEELAR
ncbi:succinate--CoA ligase subunit beta [Aeromicrobium sp. CF4.19]|uniref:succinate--CoA ligase subunit beta n=1 Tax=Aeromicrobium sp. CF4.19 TaxID=3373082 RepID=UPI003EE6B5A4